eukprot:5928094-Amphidinium_carterae.1
MTDCHVCVRLKPLLANRVVVEEQTLGRRVCSPEKTARVWYTYWIPGTRFCTFPPSRVSLTITRVSPLSQTGNSSASDSRTAPAKRRGINRSQSSTGYVTIMSPTQNWLYWKATNARLPHHARQPSYDEPVMTTTGTLSLELLATPWLDFRQQLTSASRKL